MNKRFKRFDTVIEAARRTLSNHAQEELAALVEEFVRDQTLKSEAPLTAEQESRLEQRLDASHPVSDSADYDRWLRTKVGKAIREADAHPDRRTSLAEIRTKFCLGS